MEHCLDHHSLLVKNMIKLYCNNVAGAYHSKECTTSNSVVAITQITQNIFAARRVENFLIVASTLCHAVDVAYLGLGGKQDGGYT